MEGIAEGLHVTEFIKDRFYFVTYRTKKLRRNTSSAHYFTTDDVFVYKSFYADFGPLNIAQVCRYVEMVRGLLRSESLAKKRVVHWTTSEKRSRANAAFLAGAFAVVELGFTPKAAYASLLAPAAPFLPFQDANRPNSVYHVRLLDCLNALNKALFFRLVDLSDFDVEEYERYESYSTGDLSWVVPGKLLAFAGPTPTSAHGTVPERFLPYFKANRVRTVVRLNRPLYDPNRFTVHGLEHYELYFVDGTVPSREIVLRFLKITECTKYAVAVHCKAGLGRTGCLIGVYLMKHYKMTALEAISWLRICRPGCIIGHQQSWLEDVQPLIWKLAEKPKGSGVRRVFEHHAFGIYSRIREKVKVSDLNLLGSQESPNSTKRGGGGKKGSGERVTQGDRLRAAKNSRTTNKRRDAT